MCHFLFCFVEKDHFVDCGERWSEVGWGGSVVQQHDEVSAYCTEVTGMLWRGHTHMFHCCDELLWVLALVRCNLWGAGFAQQCAGVLDLSHCYVILEHVNLVFCQNS